MGPAPSEIRARERAHDDDPQAEGLSETHRGVDQPLAEVSTAKLHRHFCVENREGLRRLPIVKEGHLAIDRQFEPAALGVVRNDETGRRRDLADAHAGFNGVGWRVARGKRLVDRLVELVVG